MRAATWNLESPRATAVDRAMQRDLMTVIAADIWVVTEAHAELPLDGMMIANSHSMIGGPAGYFATIAARDLTPLDMPEVPTGAAAIVTVGERELLVVGVCTPWRRNAPMLPPCAAPEARTGPEAWHAIVNHLERALLRLQTELGKSPPMLIGGDFNQTLVGPELRLANARDSMLNLAARFNLVAYTAQERSASPGYAAIDHLFGPPAPHRATSWMPTRPPGRSRPISDHAAHAVDLWS